MKNVLLLISTVMILAGVPVSAEVVDWTFITIDNQAVPYGEFEQTYKDMKVNGDKMGDPSLKNLGYTNVLDLLINNRILSLEAKKREIDVNEQDIDQRIAQFKKMNNLTDELFKQVLKQQGFTEKELRKNYRDQIRTEKLQDLEIRNRVRAPSDDEIHKFYNENKSKMRSPEKKLASHILFKMDQNSSLNDQLATKKKMEAIYKQAVAGADFAKLAKQYSMDEASAVNGGTLGWIAKGDMVPEFEAQTFALKNGQVSQPFPSRYGIHIVKVFDTKSSVAMPFEEAKLNIKPLLMQRSMHDEFVNWIMEKRKLYGIRLALKDGSGYLYTNGRWKEEKSGKYMTQSEFYKFITSKLSNG